MASFPILLLASFIVTFTTTWVNAELFTAQVELEPLHDAQQSIIDALNEFVRSEEKKLDDIRSRVDRYLDRMRKSQSDLISNPINAFLLVKGLTVDLDDVIGIAGSETNKLGLF